MEQWKDVIDFEGLYEVSNHGNIRKKYKTINRKVSSDNNKGYLKVGLCKGGKQSTHKVHRLVAKAFIPNPENKPLVNHKDGNKTNNHVDNLEWVTHSENQVHSYDTGLRKTLLNEQEVIEIYDLAYHRIFTLNEIGDLYGLSKSHVFQIKTKQNWKRVLD